MGQLEGTRNNYFLYRASSAQAPGSSTLSLPRGSRHRLCLATSHNRDGRTPALPRSGRTSRGKQDKTKSCSAPNSHSISGSSWMINSSRIGDEAGGGVHGDLSRAAWQTVSTWDHPLFFLEHPGSWDPWGVSGHLCRLL